MLKYLKLENVGPAAEMELNLAPRLNIITGDNGLGKSFLLDVAWFVQSGCWPEEINPHLRGGRIGMPGSAETSMISYQENQSEQIEFSFDFSLRSWFPQFGIRKDSLNTLVIYLMSDGSGAVFDPNKNDDVHFPLSLPATKESRATVFDPNEIWDGLKSEEGKWLCNGLIRDWATWQGENSPTFRTLKKVLTLLSASESELLKPGSLTRISIDDSRRMPTITMPYGNEVPLIHTSAAMRRIMAFAYIVVWAWEDHQSISRLRRRNPVKNMLILFDEVEAHLHPSWQRKILPALVGVGGTLDQHPNVQFLATTHSPLVMASLEPHFDHEKDRWFDLDLVRDNGSKPEVRLTERPFRKYGDAESWLHSRAFDLSSTRSLEGEALLKEAKKLMGQSDPSPETIKSMHQRLVDSLDSMDEFLDYWRLFWRKKRGAE